MIYVFIPYYNEDTPEFAKSLKSQTVTSRIIRRNTKKSKILWTEAVNDFWGEVKRWDIRDDDIIGVMNNDIEFPSYFFDEATALRQGEVGVPIGCSYKVDWKYKKFTIEVTKHIDSFMGRCFFMTAKDFKESGGFCKWLPHALSDIDFGYRIIKSGIKPIYIHRVTHKEHGYPKVSRFSKLSYKNPIYWTIFLLRHPNRYTLINILKSWYEIFR